MIAVSAKLGCLAAGLSANDPRTAAALRYAEGIGLAFQIVDDVLDATADAAELGKPIGSDAENHKTTFLTYYTPGDVDQVQIVLEPSIEHHVLDLIHWQSEGEDAGGLGVLVSRHKLVREGVVGVHEVDVTLVMGDRVIICFDGFFPGMADQGLPVLVRDTDDDLDRASQEAQRFSKLDLEHFFIAAVFYPVLFLPYV